MGTPPLHFKIRKSIKVHSKINKGIPCMDKTEGVSHSPACV